MIFGKGDVREIRYPGGSGGAFAWPKRCYKCGGSRNLLGCEETVRHKTKGGNLVYSRPFLFWICKGCLLNVWGLGSEPGQKPLSPKDEYPWERSKKGGVTSLTGEEVP